MHAPYAIFQKYAKEHNKNRKIGLICALDTRMGGHIIALQHLIHLKPALRNAVTSCEYIALKVTYFLCFVHILFVFNGGILTYYEFTHIISVSR